MSSRDALLLLEPLLWELKRKAVVVVVVVVVIVVVVGAEI